MNAADFVTYTLMFFALYFEVFLLLTFIENLKTVRRKNEKISLSGFPSVTIMVPVWNEEKTVAKTVSSLLSLSYPKENLKIFIINDGSTDKTAATLKKFENHPQISIFHKENGGKYTALNLGLKHAKSELVGCLDADSFVKKDALRHIVRAFEEKEVMAVVPSIKVHKPKSVFELLQAAEYMLSIFMRFVLSAVGSQYITPGPFSFFRSEVFNKLGGYKRAHNTEDMEIALRMQSTGMKIVNAHKAHVYTVAPNTFYKLYRQRVRWYHGSFQNLLDYKHLFFSKEHGTLGLFILPAVTVSIFTVFYFLGLVIYNAILVSSEKINYWQAVNWEISMSLPNINLFNVSGSSIEILAVLGIALAGTVILIGKYISEERVRVGKDMLWYFLLYGLIMPIWFIKPLFNTLFSRMTSWR